MKQGISPQFSREKMKDIILIKNFIQATRDSGYRGTYAALAEIIDNSLEAEAQSIEIKIEQIGSGVSKSYEVSIIDDGAGMNSSELNQALQFGGSSKFNSRKGLGRYGMGLPNSSLSQAKRVEVITWKSKSRILYNYLDVDDIAGGKASNIGEPVKLNSKEFFAHSASGTIVKWLKCDRLSYKNLKSLIDNLHRELGRIFRYAIWRGIKITVNNKEIIPIDPLFLKAGENLLGGRIYGEELIYDVKVPGKNFTSKVAVRFVELPLEWSKYSNEEKQAMLITKRAGMSIVRSLREIDYGWFFAGNKRKENYDDWWRCEISFSPELDELFGVTHTKQEIHPTEALKSILVPDIEQIARELNNRVRNRFIELKKLTQNLNAKNELERADVFISPPKSDSKKKEKLSQLLQKIKTNTQGASVINGLHYYLDFQGLKESAFYTAEYSSLGILVQLNSNHPFYSKVYHPLIENQKNAPFYFIKQLEILIFAAARAESLLDEKQKRIARIYRDNWSRVLSTYLT